MYKLKAVDKSMLLTCLIYMPYMQL